MTWNKSLHLSTHFGRYDTWEIVNPSWGSLGRTNIRKFWISLYRTFGQNDVKAGQKCQCSPQGKHLSPSYFRIIFLLQSMNRFYAWVAPPPPPYPPRQFKTQVPPPRAFGIYCDPLNLHLLHFILAQDDNPSTMVVWWSQSNRCTERKCGCGSNKGLPNERYWTILALYSLILICNTISG